MPISFRSQSLRGIVRNWSMVFWLRQSRDYQIILLRCLYFSFGCINKRIYFQINIRPHSRKCLVVLHSDINLIVHCKPRGVSHRWKDGSANKLPRRPSIANWSPIWHTIARFNMGLLQSKTNNSLYHSCNVKNYEFEKIPKFSFYFQHHKTWNIHDVDKCICITLHYVGYNSDSF